MRDCSEEFWSLIFWLERVRFCVVGAKDLNRGNLEFVGLFSAL